jgi:hypothetical protein
MGAPLTILRILSARDNVLGTLDHIYLDLLSNTTFMFVIGAAQSVMVVEYEGNNVKRDIRQFRYTIEPFPSSLEGFRVIREECILVLPDSVNFVLR